MAVVSDITTVANATGASHGYTLTEYTTTSQGVVQKVSKLTKRLSVPNAGAPTEFGGMGVDSSTFTQARANALVSLNNVRRHRYAGAPGNASGATVTTNEHLDVLTVDAN
jgi:hypothetical protein